MRVMRILMLIFAFALIASPALASAHRGQMIPLKGPEAPKSAATLEAKVEQVLILKSTGDVNVMDVWMVPVQDRIRNYIVCGTYHERDIEGPQIFYTDMRKAVMFTRLSLQRGKALGCFGPYKPE
jgi:hypothetical protein